ncbi:MAG TPA: DUF2071 domain-containing protein [Acidimicrobiales bacterium]|nr:DUF2071 domain-containing protein [Acidimicrobiales bacterium]
MTLTIDARIERRLLVNWRANPDVVAPLLPAPFRPQLVDGSAVIGICFVRLGHLRPRGLPAGLGLRSESAAHRIAVERDTPDGVKPAVYVLRRVTDSRLAVVAGGRLFPGVHSHGTFDVRETTDQLDIAFTTADGRHDASVSAQLTDALHSRLFASMGDISTFFGSASVGWSPSRTTDALEGVELASEGWSMMPAMVQDARSSYFDDPQRFPPGSTELDSAVLMRELPVSWRALSHDELNTDAADQRSRAERQSVRDARVTL